MGNIKTILRSIFSIRVLLTIFILSVLFHLGYDIIKIYAIKDSVENKIEATNKRIKTLELRQERLKGEWNILKTEVYSKKYQRELDDLQQKIDDLEDIMWED